MTHKFQNLNVNPSGEPYRQTRLFGFHGDPPSGGRSAHSAGDLWTYQMVPLLGGIVHRLSDSEYRLQGYRPNPRSGL